LARLHGNPYAGESFFPDVYTIGDRMTAMGYTEEDKRAAQDALHPWDGPLARFYNETSKTDTFKDKVRKLHDYNEGYAPDKLRPANHDEIFLDIVAYDDLMPELCEKISPNSFKEVAVPYNGRVSYKLSVRNNCFFAAAQKTLRTDFCSKVERLDFGPSTLTSLTRGKCEYQITQSVRTGRSYGYIYFIDSTDDVVHALRGLGYDKPFLADAKEFSWADFYMYLEFDAPSGERQRFVDRVKTLRND